jgi:RNA polymerase sigma factor (sigma-70 family)
MHRQPGPTTGNEAKETRRMASDRPNELSSEPRRDGSLEVLFLALEGPLLAYALRLLRHHEMAEDIVQEAFLKLQQQGDEVREPRGWLYRTVHNLAINHLRTETRMVSFNGPANAEGAVDDVLADLQPLPDEQLARWEAIGRVRLGMEGLDSRSRQLVHLKFSENLSYKEISGRTGLTPGHVGYLLHHALKTLADDLTQAGLLP